MRSIIENKEAKIQPPYALGIDVGGTNLKIVAVTEQGLLLSQRMCPTVAEDTEWVRHIQEQIAAVEREVGRGAHWIGLAAPGLAAADGRSIAWMQGRLEAVQGLDWTDALEWPKPIPVLNDAHAALSGEIWTGSARGFTNVMMLTLGTGVGGAAMVDGHLLRGQIGRAGHLGHICLNPYGPRDIVKTPGSLEDAIGDCTIRERSEGRFTSTVELVTAHQAGDQAASAVWLRSVEHLACGIVSLVNVLDPEVVILGGGTAKAGSALFYPLQRYLDAYEWRPTGSRVLLLPADLGDWAGAFGAAGRALGVHIEN